MFEFRIYVNPSFFRIMIKIHIDLLVQLLNLLSLRVFFDYVPLSYTIADPCDWCTNAIWDVLQLSSLRESLYEITDEGKYYENLLLRLVVKIIKKGCKKLKSSNGKDLQKKLMI